MTSPFQRPATHGLVFLATVMALVGYAQPAAAQLQLPGAFTPAPAGSVVTPSGGAAKLKPKARAASGAPAAPKVPADDSVIGRPLMLNGRSGRMEFGRNGKDLQIVKLKLAGDQMSRNGEACEVDVAGSPLSLIAAGRPVGVTRYDVDLPACPFSVDIEQGAVVAVTNGKACEIRAADCRVDPAGMWGQPASEIGPERTKEIEQGRRHAEQEMRSHFKAWLATAEKDRTMVSRIAREQAGFSSRREELCRSYAREAQHGYCALVATQARSSAIAARILPPLEPDDDYQTASPKKPAKKR